MIKCKHIQHVFNGFVHFCGVGGVGVSVLWASLIKKGQW